MTIHCHMPHQELNPLSLQKAREHFLHYFLILSMLPAVFYTVLDTYHGLYAGVATDVLCFLASFISWYSLRRQGLKHWHTHLAMFGGLLIFTPILCIESLGNTAIYWMPIIPALAFMIGGIRGGMFWVVLYISCIILLWIGGTLGWISLLYNHYEIFTMTLVTLFISMISYFFTRYLDEANRILKAAFYKAEEQSHAKSRFLSTISHDLRTPIHGIIGIHALLLEDSKHWNAEQREHLNLAQHASLILKELINDVLDLAKIEAGKISVRHQHIDMYDFFKDILLPFAFQAKNKGIQLQLQLQNTPTSIHHDAQLLRQIMLNLISNAIKFTEQGSIAIQVRFEAPELHIQVQDTGIGIAPNDLKHLFESFYQADTLHQFSGTGLGMSIVQQLTQLLEGHIEVQSELGKGSCFHITIPCPKHSNTNQHGIWKLDDLLSSHTPKIPHPSSTTSRCSTLHVLLVEDDPITQHITKKTFQRAGISVALAHHGEEALKMLQERHYDLVLTDLNMPHMDGITLTKHIRAQHGSDIIIIGLSAHAMSDTVLEGKEAGMNDFLIKPVSPEAILARIQPNKGGNDA